MTKNQGKNQQRRLMSLNRLQNIALYYCQRFLVSEAKLEDYLKGRLFREVRDPEEREKFLGEIPGLVKNLSKTGYVNDKEAASAKLRIALRSGYAVGAALRKASQSSMVPLKLVQQELKVALEEALPDIQNFDVESSEDLIVMALSALKHAGRGPFRKGQIDQKTERRDIAWLQRRGYHFDDILKAMQLENTSCA